MDVSPTTRRFTISFNRFLRAVMTPMLTGPRRCAVVVGTDELHVTMGLGGWAFAARVPRSAISAAGRVDGPVWAWGAHGWRGQWLVNGSSQGLVRLTIEPPGHGRCLGFPVKLRQLTLSLDEPDAFIAALA